MKKTTLTLLLAVSTLGVTGCDELLSLFNSSSDEEVIVDCLDESYTDAVDELFVVAQCPDDAELHEFDVCDAADAGTLDDLDCVGDQAAIEDACDELLEVIEAEPPCPAPPAIES